MKFETFEHLDMEMTHVNKSIRIIALYRPPSTSRRSFIMEFSSFLESIDNFDHLYICGDFNIWLDSSTDPITNEFKELIESYDLINGVPESTSRSGHILDLILFNNCETISNLEIDEDFDYSYFHKLIKFELNIRKNEDLRKEITFKDKRGFNPQLLIEQSIRSLESNDTPCECPKTGTETEFSKCIECYTQSYRKIFQKNYHEMCPLITKKIVIKDKSKWFNGELHAIKKRKRKAEKKWRTTRSTQSRLEYTSIRNYYNEQIKKAKIKFYNEGWKNDLESKRRDLDELLGKKREKILPKGDLNKILAEKFSVFFDSKVRKICVAFNGKNSSNPEKGVDVCTSQLNEFEQVNIENFKKIMKKVKPTFCGSDPVPIADLRDADNFFKLEEIYLNIVNMSITSSKFPQSEKMACIIPTYKGKGDCEELNSYRPISNLTNLSKVIEVAVHEQLLIYLKENDLISENQSAYRENHSTETTICAVMDDLTKIVDEGRCGILVMLDLSAAFDTVDHAILLKDLKDIGIGKSALKWFANYLENRYQSVHIFGESSVPRRLERGVPQGSILGPTLFNIYTTGLSSILKKHDVGFQLYADDTQFYFPIANIAECVTKVQSIMTEIMTWMCKKKLKLNEEKTVCMLFGSKDGLSKLERIEKMKICTTEVLLVDSVRNLGVEIDKNLKMDKQIFNTVRSCNYQLRNITFIRKYLNEATTEMLVHNYVMSKLDYCNSIYHRLPNNLLTKLQIIQKKAARLVRRKSYSDRITPELISLHWLPIKARIIYKICLLVFKTVRTGYPVYLKDKLIPFELATSMNVRHNSDSHRLFEPRVFKGIGDRSFRNCAPRLFNILPIELKSTTTLKSFKKDLKTLLFKRCYDIEHQELNVPYKL